jgi:serine/threonine-protein kinase HipA
MTLAEHSGIEVPVHGLVEATDGSMVYFIRRFDRVGQGERLPLEDGAQLLGHTRDTKYDSSMEQVIGMIERFCTFPVIEKRKLMQRVWFCFLTGNEDMHLKNWSLLSRSGRIALSPAYDLLNTSIILKNPQEETALPIRGRQRNLNRRDLLDYLAVERCGLQPDLMRGDLEKLLLQAEVQWPTWIQHSFLSEPKRQAYLHLVRERVARLLS